MAEAKVGAIQIRGFLMMLGTCSMEVPRPWATKPPHLFSRKLMTAKPTIWAQQPDVYKRQVSINMISKSGTTTEPAIAFRVFRELREKKYGKEGARERIFCTTDKARGTLKHLADEEGYETFVVPDDVGGRYYVLTAVGLLPIAVAGADLDALMAGAAKAMELYNTPVSYTPPDVYKRQEEGH